MIYAQIAYSVLVRNARVLLGRLRFGVVTALLLASAASFSCGEAKKTPAPPSGPVTLRFGVALPKTPESAIGFKAFVNGFFSESLVGTREDGSQYRRLAADWQWKDNNLTLELTIRDGLKFHDGTLVDAAFIKDTLTDVFKTPLAVSYKSVTSVDVIDKRTVAIRLSRPEALLVADLSNATISMRDRNKADLGLGAYRLVERGSRTRLDSFADFYRGKPKIDVIEIQEFEEQRTAWAALMRGEIDAVHEIVPSALPFIKGQNSLKTYPFTRPYFIHLLFNVKHPVLKDPRVRQALSYAIDRQAIIDQGLDGQGTIADGPIWPHHWAYSTAQKAYNYNLEAATLRLDAARLAVKKVHEAGRMPSRFRFTCLTLEKNATFEKIAILVQKQLYEIGVDMEIETLPIEELGKRANAGNFDAILAEKTSGRSLVWTYLVFHSNKFGGSYQSANATLDHLRLAMDKPAVRADVNDLQQIFHDDPPAIFIAWPTVARVVNTKFEVPQDSSPDDKNDQDEVRSPDVMNSIWRWRPAGSP